MLFLLLAQLLLVNFFRPLHDDFSAPTLPGYPSQEAYVFLAANF